MDVPHSSPGRPPVSLSIPESAPVPEFGPERAPVSTSCSERDSVPECSPVSHTSHAGNRNLVRVGKSPEGQKWPPTRPLLPPTPLSPSAHHQYGASPTGLTVSIITVAGESLAFTSSLWVSDSTSARRPSSSRSPPWPPDPPHHPGSSALYLHLGLLHHLLRQRWLAPWSYQLFLLHGSSLCSLVFPQLSRCVVFIVWSAPCFLSGV